MILAGGALNCNHCNDRPQEKGATAVVRLD
jgi:hypothetical protein